MGTSHEWNNFTLHVTFHLQSFKVTITKLIALIYIITLQVVKDAVIT